MCVMDLSLGFVQTDALACMITAVYYELQEGMQTTLFALFIIICAWAPLEKKTRAFTLWQPPGADLKLLGFPSWHVIVIRSQLSRIM